MTAVEKNKEVFDLDEWKQQGEDALQTLRDKEKEYEEKLSETKTKIAALSACLAGDSPEKKKRFRLRPTILKVIESSSEITWEGLLEKVQQKIPGAHEGSIKTSALRLAAQNLTVNFDADSEVFSYVNVKPTKTK